MSCSYWIPRFQRNCKNPAISGSSFCRIHRKQQENIEKKQDVKEVKQMKTQTQLKQLPERKIRVTSRLRNCKIVGEGANAIIEACEVGKVKMAVKKVNMKNSQLLYDLVNELSWDAKHENVASPVSVQFVENKQARIFYELAESDLADFLSNHSLLKPELRETLFRDIVCGLHALHSRNFTHNDLKPANILVFQRSSSATKYKAALGDVGSISKIYATWNPCSTIWTDAYSPPEFIQKQFCTKERDLWALGLIGLSLYDPTLDLWFLELLETIKDKSDSATSTEENEENDSITAYATADFATVFQPTYSSLITRSRKEENSNQKFKFESPFYYLSSEAKDFILTHQKQFPEKWKLYSKQKLKIIQKFQRLKTLFRKDTLFANILNYLLKPHPSDRSLDIFLTSKSYPSTKNTKNTKLEICEPTKLAPFVPMLSLEKIFPSKATEEMKKYRFTEIDNDLGLSPTIQDRIAIVAANLLIKLPKSKQNLIYLKTIHHLLAVLMESFPNTSGLDLTILGDILETIPEGLIGFAIQPWVSKLMLSSP
jgi:serine/threonine protein kinase